MNLILCNLFKRYLSEATLREYFLYGLSFQFLDYLATNFACSELITKMFIKFRSGLVHWQYRCFHESF